MSGPYATYKASLNKYAYMPLVQYAPQNIPPVNVYQTALNTKLCEIAGMEGWHDHHGIFGLGNKAIEASVKEYTPPSGCNGQARLYSEEQYLSHVLTVDPNIIPPPNRNTTWKMTPQNKDVDVNNEDKWYGDTTDPAYNTWLNNFGDNIKTKYIIARVVLDKSLPDVGYSKVQKCFNMNGITDSVYILRDVAYGNWARDIKKWGNNIGPTYSASAANQVIYNVQTSSGIYDPGPSLSYFSGAGIKCGYQNTNCMSRYGLFDCSFTTETMLDYPAFVESLEITSAEQLMYTKYNCRLFGDNTISLPHDSLPKNDAEMVVVNNPVQIAYKDAEKMIDSAAVNLIVEVPEGQLYIVTKYTSNKASSILDLPFISCCIKYTASADVIDIARSEYKFEEYNIITRSGPLKIMTKKFGDSGIAIQTLRPELNFYAFEPILNEPTTVTIKPEKSNGIHAFLTYDQVASAAAIEYGAPVVIYTTHEYAIIFISKIIRDTLSNPEQKLINVRDSIKDPFPNEGGVDNVAITNTESVSKSTSDAAAAATAAISKAFKEIQTNILAKIPNPPDQRAKSTQYDIFYRDYLSFWYKLAPFIKIYNDATKANTILNTTAANITSDYNLAKKTAGQDIQVLTDIDTLTTISNSYREYTNMIKKYTSIEDTFTHITTSVLLLTKSPNKIKIGDASKIISNCDPYNGTYKEYRIRKMLTSFQGQAQSGIELGITIIIEIYENLSDESVRTMFTEQIITLFNNIASTCATALRPKILLAFDFIPDAPKDYRSIFVSDVARGTITLGGATKRGYSTMLGTPENSLLATSSSLIDSKSSVESIPLSKKQAIEVLPSMNSPDMFEDVVNQLTELIIQVDKFITENLQNAELLSDMKPLLDATKSVIQQQGETYINTLSSPLSYEHLKADALIHQPLFIFSILQTILGYGSITVDASNQMGGVLDNDIEMVEDKKRPRDDDNVGLPKIPKNDIDVADIIDIPPFNSRNRTRSETAPFRQDGVLEPYFTSNQNINLNIKYKNLTGRVFLLTDISNPTIVDVINLGYNLLPSVQYVVVYGYLITFQELIQIVQAQAIKVRSSDVQSSDKSNIPTDIEPIIIDDVTTSYSITNSIMLRNRFDVDFNSLIDTPDETAINAPTNSDLFTTFVYYANKVSRKDDAKQLIIDQTLVDVLNRMLTQLSTTLKTTLISAQYQLSDYEYMLTAIFPTTYDSISAKGGKRNKKTIRKRQTPKSNKNKKTKKKQKSKKAKKQSKKKLILKIKTNLQGSKKAKSSLVSFPNP